MTHRDDKLPKNDVEKLREIAKNTDNPQLRRAAEERIKKIDKPVNK